MRWKIAQVGGITVATLLSKGEVSVKQSGATSAKPRSQSRPRLVSDK
jgi:hypothetical protein